MRKEFRIIVDIPKGVTVDEMAVYMGDALTHWCKGFFPGDEENDPDPMFNFDASTMDIYRVKRLES